MTKDLIKQINATTICNLCDPMVCKMGDWNSVIAKIGVLIDELGRRDARISELEQCLNEARESEGGEAVAYFNPADAYWIENGGKVSVCGQRTNTFTQPLYSAPQPDKWIRITEDCARMSIEALEKFTRDIRNGATSDPEPIEHYYGMQAIDELMSALPATPEQESEK